MSCHIFMCDLCTTVLLCCFLSVNSAKGAVIRMTKRVCIIGSGASGLCAIKSCMEEGLEPVCYERTDYIGGLWYYTQKVSDGQSCVMKSTIINTSKEIMSYSDFPVPADSPMYMHNTKVVEYLRNYSQHFGMDKYVRFNHEVLSVKQAEDFENTGRWIVEVRDKDKGETRTEVFDGVLVCSGHHADKRIPKFEGLEDFKGTVVHTHDYRDHVGYEGKRVVVIGIGNSGGDVAVELSRVSDQVYLSTRRGTWILNRIYDNGYPADLLIFRRSIEALRNLLPRSVVNTLFEIKLNMRFNHENYGLKPEHRFDAQHPMVNDEMPNRIASGTIKIRPDIKKFGATSVEFVDGTVEENIDAVILGTGFKFGFPFIQHAGLEVEDNEVNLYKFMYAPDISPPTLAVIGCIQPVGAIMPISEIQCRVAARVISGKATLPGSSEMWAEIRQRRDAMSERYVKSPRHTIQVDYVDIMDQIGNLIGCTPDIWKLFWEDPKLALKCYFGSFVPYQYRLTGPHQWEGARDAIMTVWDRTLSGTSTKKKPTVSKPLILYVVGALIVALLIRWLINGLF